LFNTSNEFGSALGWRSSGPQRKDPVDVTSGQILGNAYADAIIANDAFKAAAARLRSEAETAN